MGTEYLIACGHTTVGFVSGPARVETAAQRLEGYEQAMATAWLRSLVAYGDYRFEGGVTATGELLRGRGDGAPGRQQPHGGGRPAHAQRGRRAGRR